MERSVGVVAFAFGSPSSIASNEAIAKIASAKAKEFGAIVFTQWDVSVEPSIEVAHIYEHRGKPPPTLRIARWMIVRAAREGLQELWLVAATPHLWRCRRDLEYAVHEVKAQIKINACEGIEQYPDATWFCTDSTQKRTQSRKNWQVRERILKWLPMFVYKLVAN